MAEVAAGSSRPGSLPIPARWRPVVCGRVLTPGLTADPGAVAAGGLMRLGRNVIAARWRSGVSCAWGQRDRGAVAVGGLMRLGCTPGQRERIDGVSRSLPYSDLLALTSSRRILGIN